MKIYKVILLLLLGVTLVACERHYPTIEPESESYINGQLCYMANPLIPDIDTILCIDNIYVAFHVNNYEYCSYTRELLSHFVGKLTECPFHEASDINYHHWEFCANKGQYIYPIFNGEFVSLIDSNTGMIADSVILNGRTIYPKQERNNKPIIWNQFYKEDFICFNGNDHMMPKLITDTVTPFGDTIVCYDGHNGPYHGSSALILNNIN